MNRFAKMTFAAAALTLGAMSALPASADIVVSLRGKTAQQVSAEIHAAAVSVCRQEALMSPLVDRAACVAGVIDDTMAQLPPALVASAR